MTIGEAMDHLKAAVSLTKSSAMYEEAVETVENYIHSIVNVSDDDERFTFEDLFKTYLGKTIEIVFDSGQIEGPAAIVINQDVRNYEPLDAISFRNKKVSLTEPIDHNTIRVVLE